MAGRSCAGRVSRELSVPEEELLEEPDGAWLGCVPPARGGDGSSRRDMGPRRRDTFRASSPPCACAGRGRGLPARQPERMWRRALRARAPRRSRSQAAGRCCWSCGAPLGSGAAGPGFCPSCRALQPPEPRADLFGVLGCPRGFSLDLARLRQRFLALQRSLHPDRFGRRPQAERGFSEQHAALINLAYGTLRSPLSRGLYLLELRGVELAAGSDAEAEPGFLAEVLELNEQLAAADSEASLAGLERLLAAKQEALVQEVSRAFEQDDLHKARRLLGKMKYFANLEEKVKEKKAPS